MVQGRGRLVANARRGLGERFLGLRLVPCVGRSGHHLSAERSWVFVECTGGGLVVGLICPIIMIGLLDSYVCIKCQS
jgi:hypothetical protein